MISLESHEHSVVIYGKFELQQEMSWTRVKRLHAIRDVYNVLVDVLV